MVCGFKKKHFPEEEYNFEFLHDLLKICEDYSVQRVSMLYIELKKIFGIKNFSELTDEFNSHLMQNIELKNTEEILKSVIKFYESDVGSKELDWSLKVKEAKENLNDCLKK